MNKLVLATGNSGKVREMAELLQAFGFDVRSQSEFALTEAEETGTTFVENAIIKARHAAEQTGLPAIADDSGLEVDFLKGAPGVHSARFAGKSSSDSDNIKKLLKDMKSAKAGQRDARFHCVLVYLRHANDPVPLICHGVFEGQISKKASGTEGFGYDPVFFLPEFDCTVAELPAELKKQISHRGQALRDLFAELKLEARYNPDLKRVN